MLAKYNYNYNELKKNILQIINVSMFESISPLVTKRVRKKPPSKATKKL
jgi:hypothetical protein